MKYFKLLVGVILLVVFSSCKKAYVFSQSDLIGTWIEISPYPPIDTSTHSFRFTADSVFGITPYLTRGPYTLVNSHTIRIDCSIPEGPSCAGLGTYSFQIDGSPNSLVFYNFFGGLSQSGPPPSWNLYMKKIN